jgi:dienelactone hydrolase
MRRRGFMEEAQRRGYLLATPNGRGPFGGYRGAAGADVLEVLDRMLAMYPIDPAQVFLTGHSMGGGGTWRVGFQAPDRFAALAPIAGAPPPNAVDLDAAPEMPVLFSAGVKDRTVPIENVRRLARAAEPKLENLTYVEYPEDGHADVPDSAMLPIFDFFDKHRTTAD